MRTIYNIKYTIDGTALDGETTRRPYAVATAEIGMRIETKRALHLDLHPDIVQYAYDDEALELLIPSLSPDWIRTPIKLADNPRLRLALETEEVTVRITTADEERVFRATHIASKRWGSDDPVSWKPGPVRNRLLIQTGRDGAPSRHHEASRVRTIRELGDEHLVVLHDLVLPTRTTCVFCDAARPASSEHVVPKWAKEHGEMGITVASCLRCNNRLSKLESAIADISRRRPEALNMAERTLLFGWTVKTISVLGRALHIDPLLAWGDQAAASLLGPAVIRPVECHVDVDEVFSSVDPTPSASFLKYSSADLDRPWALLRVRNLVTSIWLRRIDAPV